MSILGNIDELMNKEDEDLGYVTPAVIRDEKNYISFKSDLLFFLYFKNIF